MNPETSHILRRLEAMEGFLSDMITKLDQHSSIAFLFDLTKQIPGVSDFDRGTLYNEMMNGMRNAESSLSAVRRKIKFTIKDLHKTGEDTKEF